MQIGRPIEPRRLPWRKIAVAVGLVVMTFAYVIYCRHQPMSLNTYALFDDQWFVRAAQRIMAGQWLGPYDQTTLIKGPGFAYFLVVNHVLGLSLATSLALTYAAASAAISWALWRELGLDTRLSVALYALLLWEPAVVPNRVIRDAFYHSMFLFVMATVIVLALDRTPWVRYLAGVLAGVAVGWFWITREEGPWILPTSLLILVAGAWRWWRSGAVRLVLLPYSAMVALALVPVLSTSAINDRHYGVFEVSDMASGGYASAVAALSSIDDGREYARVPVTKTALEDAFEVSPAMASLRSYFEGAGGSQWYDLTCKTYPDLCGQIAGGWFGWALRAAADSTGHYHSARDADQFLQQIADDVTRACTAKRLHCRSGIPYISALSPAEWRAMPSAISAGAWKSLYQSPEPEFGPSDGLRTDRGRDDKFLGSPILTPMRKLAPGNHWVGMRVHLDSIYRIVSPLIALAGLIAMLMAIVLGVRRRRGGVATAVALAAWGAFLARLTVIAFVDVSASPAIVRQYLEPAYLAAPVAVAASFAALRAARIVELAAPDQDELVVLEHAAGGPGERE